MTKILKLSNRDFKTVIIKSFSEPLKTLLKQMEGYRKSQKLNRRYQEPISNYKMHGEIPIKTKFFPGARENNYKFTWKNK